MFVYVVCVHMSAGTHRGQRHLDPSSAGSTDSRLSLDTSAGTEPRSSAGAVLFTVELQALLWFLQAGLCRTQSLVLYSMHFLGDRNHREWKPTCIPLT